MTRSEELQGTEYTQGIWERSSEQLIFELDMKGKEGHLKKNVSGAAIRCRENCVLHLHVRVLPSSDTRSSCSSFALEKFNSS